jgi:hypothetical protein
VIVSEERGSISLSFNGNIAADLPVSKLRESLESIFNPRVVKRNRKVQKLRTSELPPPPVEREIEEPARISLRGSAVDLQRMTRPTEPEVHPKGRRSQSSPPPPLRKRPRKAGDTSNSAERIATPIATPVNTSTSGDKLEGTTEDKREESDHQGGDS